MDKRNEQPSRSEQPSGVALGRGLEIIRLVAERGPLKLADVADAMNLSSDTSERLVETLVAHAYLERIESSGQFRLGPATQKLANALSARIRIRDLAIPVLRSIADRCKGAAALFSSEGESMIALLNEDSSRFRATASPGRGLAISSCAAGYVYAICAKAGSAERARLEQDIGIRKYQAASAAFGEDGFYCHLDRLSETRQIAAPIRLPDAILVLQAELPTMMSEKPELAMLGKDVKTAADLIAERAAASGITYLET